jgi:D-proline reductase (dithiol) PrdB
MTIDNYRFLPGSIAAYYRGMSVPREEPVPWTPLAKPLAECRFSLITTAALHVKSLEPPFDTEREKREPMWGDPTYRRIPPDTRQEDIGACLLHLNNRDLLEDMNIVLPVHRFRELEDEGVIGSLGACYSFMGYQPDNSQWRERYAPEVAGLLKEDAVDAALITPA